ncbi:MAG TPA: MCE family protein [Aquificae bacterium]|nr:MCE family protein [Aquificota bacterium]
MKKNFFENFEKKYFLIGFFITIFLFSFYYLFTKILPNNFFYKNKKEYCLIFQDLRDLSPGTSVTVAGVKVGFIKDVKLYKNKAKVIIVVDKGITLTNNTKAYITTSSLLGSYYIALDIKPGKPLSNKVCLENTSSKTVIDVINNFGNKLAQLDIKKFNELIVSTKTFIDDINNNQKVLVYQLNKTLENFNENFLKLTKSILKIINQTNKSLNNLNYELIDTLKIYKSLGDNLNSSIYNITKELKITLKNLNLLIDNLNYLFNQTKNESLIKDLKATILKTQFTLGNLNKILNRVYNSNGTFWKVLEDNSLYNNLNQSFFRLNTLEKRIETIFPQKYEFIPEFSFYLSDKWKVRYSLLVNFKFEETNVKLGFTQINKATKLDLVFSKYLSPKFAINMGLYEGNLALGTKLSKRNLFISTYFLPFLELKLGLKFKNYSIFAGERYLYSDKTFETLVGSSIYFK